MQFKKVNQYSLKIQFEDIDMGGAVHNPNYLKFFERARNFHFEEIGIGTPKMIADGLALALAESHIKYVRPLTLAQEVRVLTKVTGLRATGLRMEQAIVDANSLAPSIDDVDFDKLKGIFCLSKGKLVCVNLQTFKPTQLPGSLVASIIHGLEAGIIVDDDISIVPAGK